MRKRIVMALAITAMLFLVLSCDNGLKHDSVVTFISNGSEVDRVTVENGSAVEKPEDPTSNNEKATFAGWYLNGEEYDFTAAVTCDITLTAYWKVADITDIPGVAVETDGETYVIGTVDGTGYIVTDWQDLWTNKDLTIMNTIFEQGVSIHTANLSSDSSLIIEGCTVYTCDQEKIIEELKENPNPNFRMDNSGDGLGIGIDTDQSQSEGFAGNVKIIIRNNAIIGENDPDEGFGSYRTQTDAMASSNKTDPRGRGISIGMASGNTKYLESALIEGNMISGIKCGGVQLFAIEKGTTITVKDNTFISWGINSDTLSGSKDYYAIRGNLASDPGVVTLEGNTYAEKSGVAGDARDLSDYRVGIDGWNSVQDGGYDQSKAR